MIIITGGSGFLGRAVSRLLPDALALASTDLDLRDGTAVQESFAAWEPAVVVHLAARVGGITENIERSADFLIDNALIDANVLAAVRAAKPDYFIPMLSTCMYPDVLPDDRYPMGEDAIEDGPPPPTNAAYAAAKRSLWHGTRAVHEQYGVPYCSIIPANLYGPGDHFGEAKSHFLAAAISKIEAARSSGGSRVEFFGTGRALRQYVYVEDVAQVIVRLLGSEPANAEINIAPTQNRSIRDLAHAVAKAAGFDGDITFTGSGPDGQLRKDVSTDRLRELMPSWRGFETDLDSGLSQTIDWYRDHVAAG